MAEYRRNRALDGSRHEGHWRDFDPRPNAVWLTSPGRTQGLWLWHRYESPGRAQAYSQALARQFGGDPNGWSITKLLRIPFTFNHKPQYRRPEVELLEFKSQSQRRRPALSPNKSARRLGANWEASADPDAYDPEDVLARYKTRMDFGMWCLARHKRIRSRDRSRCIFMIVASLHEAGAIVDEIAAVVWRSPYFLEKHGKRLVRLNAELTRIVSKLGGPND